MFFGLVLLLLLIHSVHCFLNFPPSGENAVTSFLDTVSVKTKKTEDTTDIMSKSVRGELCVRECRVDDRRVCYFKFMIKYYQVMSGWESTSLSQKIFKQ